MGANITLAGESLIAQKHAAKAGLKVVRFIFANVPGLNISGPVDRAAGKPLPAHIVHVHQIPDDNAGFVNPNQVVYSSQIGSDVGDWDFNWIGLETEEEVLFAVAYVPIQQKRRNIPQLQIGNNLTRNFLLEFDGAQALTGVVIDARTWQHDFTVRLAGIDERERLSNRDVYGRACFFANGLQVEKVGSAYQLKPGTAYIEGIRLVRTAALPIVPPSYPNTVWIDIALQRELNDVVAKWTVVFGGAKSDYVDSVGVQHYCVALADLPDANTIVDRRPGEPITGPLVQHFALRNIITNVSVNTSLTRLNRGLVLVDASAGQRTITLPASNPDLAVVDIVIRRVDNGVERLVVQAAGTDKIKFHTHLNAAGYSFLLLMGAGDWWHLRSDGAGSWWPIGRYDNTPLGRPVFETTNMFSPGGYGALNSPVLKRTEWPWLWDHAQQSGMLTSEAGRVGREGGWTSGDGVLTFRGPEGRGEFLRVLDEGAGIDTGRVAGSRQIASQLRTAASNIASSGGSASNVWNNTEFDQIANQTLWVPSTTSVAGSYQVGFVRPRNVAYPGRIKLI